MLIYMTDIDIFLYEVILNYLPDFKDEIAEIST